MKSRHLCLWFYLLLTATEQSVDYFEKADVNSDGIVDAAEFSSFMETQAHLYENSNQPLTKAQLYHLASLAAIGKLQKPALYILGFRH